MQLVQTALTFILVLGVLVFFHELGHFGFAKLFKMRVEEFAIGFGKRVVRVFHDGETEYNLRALPLGGFVRIAGMEIEDSVESRLTGGGGGDAARYRADAADSGRPEPAAAVNTNTALLEQEAAEVDHAVANGFNSRPVYQRFLVILAGPVFSFLLGWFVLCLLGVTVGSPVGPPTTQIVFVETGKPAERAGLKPGDTITAINGRPLADGDALVKILQGSAGKPLRLSVRTLDRPNVLREVTVTPRAETDKRTGKIVGRIGIAPGSRLERVGWAESFREGTVRTALFFDQLFGIFRAGPKEVGKNVGGPIAIFGATRQAVNAGPGQIMSLLASLSLSLGFFNLLPIPVLDGGHLMLLTLEAVRRRKLTAEQTQRVLATGFAIIAVLFVVITFKDIINQFLQRS